MKYTSGDWCKAEAFTSCPGQGHQPEEVRRLNGSGSSVHAHSFDIAGTASPARHVNTITQYIVPVKALNGLTALHMANEPDVPIGSGRFGSLIPAALALFRAAWDGQESQQKTASN